jgi:murein DD-endopeptidase MepM/ murein hydrolase activator NlpD
MTVSPSRILLFLLALLTPLSGMSVRQSALGTSSSDKGCFLTNQATSFAPSEQQIFFWMVARQVRAGEPLKIEWLDPGGNVAAAANYDNLPAAPEVCLISQLPLAGFAAASQPGTWAVRGASGTTTLISRTFEIQKNPNASTLDITSVTQRAAGSGQTEFLLEGIGFREAMTIHIAQYSKTGGWSYIAALNPTSVASANRVSVLYNGVLGAGEYMAIIRNPDDRLSKPARIVVTSSGGYRVPFAGGETWQITQTPHGSFSHWGNVINAYDIAPVSGTCVVAMRPGIVYAFDKGEVQSHTNRSFGNYVTIDHGDGEFSHYAHLARGTFVVQTGQRVEAGQALARVGNSGYTLGEGGGYHVHAQVTKSFHIAAQSIPFKLSDVRTPAKGMIVRSTQPAPLGDCSRRNNSPVLSSIISGTQTLAAASPSTKPALVPLSGPRLHGTVSVGDWWHNQLTVNRGTARLQVRLIWQGPDREINLHLVSPSGRHYGWYGNTTGYSGQGSHPEEFNIAVPEAGIWRVSVQGTKGTGEAISFDVESAAPSKGKS